MGLQEITYKYNSIPEIVHKTNHNTYLLQYQEEEQDMAYQNVKGDFQEVGDFLIQNQSDK